MKSEQELLALYQAEIDDLNREKQEYLFETVDSESRKLRAELHAAREENWGLKSRIAYLEGRKARGAPVEDEIPDSFEDLQQWSTRHLAGSVKQPSGGRRNPRSKTCRWRTAHCSFCETAMCRAKEATNSGRPTWKRWRQKEFRSNERSRGAGEHGDSYFLTHKGRKRELDRHLKGSSARNSRYGFRLYFFRDDEDEEVIVGWLPEHLPTRIN